MERAQTSEVESSLMIIIVAIISGLVFVVIVSLVVYLGCFKTKRPITNLSLQQQQQQQQPQSPLNGDQKAKHSNKKQKKKGKIPKILLIKCFWVTPYIINVRTLHPITGMHRDSRVGIYLTFVFQIKMPSV